MRLNGSEILARALKEQGVDTFFFIMGGPMLAVEAAALRARHARHRRAPRAGGRDGGARLCAAAQPAGRVHGGVRARHHQPDHRRRPRLVDCTPVRGARRLGAGIGDSDRGTFQEIDQLAIMKPCTKWADRVASMPQRIPELVDRRDPQAMSGKPGPVYLDLPGDVLYARSTRAQVEWPAPWDPAKRHAARRRATPTSQAIVELLPRAEQPVLVSGSGVLWSDGARRAAGLRRGDRHSVLHDAAEPRRDPGGSRALLPATRARPRSATPTSSSSSARA